MLNVVLKSKMKWGSAFVVQIASRIEESIEKMMWKTSVEVARILLNDATVTQAECKFAVEAARAIHCLAGTRSVCVSSRWIIDRRPQQKKDKTQKLDEGRHRR